MCLREGLRVRMCACLREKERESVCVCTPAIVPVCYRSVQRCCWMSALPSSLESLLASSWIIIVLLPPDCVASYCLAPCQPSTCVRAYVCMLHVHVYVCVSARVDVMLITCNVAGYVECIRRAVLFILSLFPLTWDLSRDVKNSHPFPFYSCSFTSAEE